MFDHKEENRLPGKPSSLIDGRNILYHYLQKDLFESDIWLFQMLAARLVAGLGIWLHPDLYKSMPTILPFVLRDPSCRSRKEEDTEAWGAPSENGYLRDDNSLVKAIPRSMMVVSTKQALYNKKWIGNGFVAAHVWRSINGSHIGARLSSRDPWVNTFVPNLVWLPADVAKLSDREGTFTQVFLQALSAKIYRHIVVSPKLRPIVDRIWGMLDVPTGIPEQGLPGVEDLSFFQTSDEFIQKRYQTIEGVIGAFKTVLSGGLPIRKVVTTRYGAGLSSVSGDELTRRIEELSEYLSAISGSRPSDDLEDGSNGRENLNDG